MDIPLFKVYMRKDVGKYVDEVLQSGYIGQGRMVDLFEESLKSFFNHDYILTLNSGTSGLHLAFHILKKDLGLDSNSEVLTCPLTCTATNWPILANDLKIRWVDVDPQTLNMDLDDLARKINTNTSLILIVHWGGIPIDLDKLNSILDSTRRVFGFRPLVVEDCAHSFGAKFNDINVGIATLDLNFLGGRFGITFGLIERALLELGECFQGHKLTAICQNCRREEREDVPAQYSQRLVDGIPVTEGGVIGIHDEYEPRCESCFVRAS